MADVVPLKVARDPSNNPSGLAEFQVNDTIPISRGGTGATSVTALAAAISSLIPNTPYTDEQAQDAVGTILVDTASINLTYDDGTPQIYGDVIPGGVDHNSLANLTTGNPHTQYAYVSGTPSVGQSLVFSAGNYWIPSSIAGGAGGSGVTSLNSQTGPAITIAAVSGLAVSSGNNQINVGADYLSAIWNASALDSVDLSGTPSIAGQVLAYSTTNLAWIPSSISFPAGVGGGVTAINSLTGPAITIAGSGSVQVSSGSNQINIGLSGALIGKFSSSIGDNSATSFTVTHNLGSQDFVVNVYSVASPFTQVRPTIKHTSTTQATLEFTVAPTTNQYRVVIIG